jgi:Rhodopirellula transposase DDE domain
MGQASYPLANRVLITADAKGSNVMQVCPWKLELQKWADETGLRITVVLLQDL